VVCGALPSNRWSRQRRPIGERVHGRTGQERPTGTMIQRRGVGTVGTTDALITTATMAVVTNWVLLPCRSGLEVFEAPG